MGNIKGFLSKDFDKVNAAIAAFVFIFTFIIYRLTVQPTLSYWDCGEFIACSYILGIPHPPGFPLFVIIGRLFSIMPLAADICLRVNLLSVISSSAAACFGYLLNVRIIKYWYQGQDFTGWKRVIAYVGGVVGAFYMAFSATNWGNSVEAEVYGLSMMMLTMIFWLALIHYDNRGSQKASRIAILICYLAMLAVGIHLTSFLILPVAAVFLILKKNAPQKTWITICTLFVAELLAIIAFSDMGHGFSYFIMASIIMIGVTAFLVRQYINWPILIGIIAFSLIMIGFYQFAYGLVIGAAAILVLAAVASKKFDWKTGISILLIAVIGYSVHLFIPIRSALNPRIDENNASRDFRTFVNFLDRKQYGSQLMAERMFERRGTWSHQFGRHANMGFWSYFEEQYGITKIFGLLFLLGLFGAWFASKNKVEIGYPFFVFLLLSSVGLILYMNFADGIKYDSVTGDAYLEVRNRDYFFTPAFTYFGLAIGLGVAALMELVRRKTSSGAFAALQKPALAVMSLMVFLPVTALSENYFYCDRSNNYDPYIYSYNILQTCEENSILFTSGDNDTFPLWCVQEVYDFRKDIRVVNLSLLNTDWYIWQMKTHYDVPISLSKDQILWHPLETGGQIIPRPKEPFRDRSRKRYTYLLPMAHEGKTVKLQDMMVDEIVIENKWRVPILFSSEPYDSPLKLRELAYAKGVLYELSKDPPQRLIDPDEGYRLYNEVYRYDGLDDPDIYRDENASGVLLSLGFNAQRVAQEYRVRGNMDKAKEILRLMIDKYPEFFQSYITLSEYYEEEGDTLRADSVLVRMETTLAELLEKNPKSQFYMMDLGLAKHYLGKDEEALTLLWDAFRMNPNSSYAYRKLFQFLFDMKRYSELYTATQMFSSYKRNLSDPIVQEVLGMQAPTAPDEGP